MQDKKRINGFWKKTLNKYRFVIMADDSFEEKFSLKTNRLKVFLFLSFFTLFCVVATFILITNTSLREFIPGKESEEVQREIISLVLRSDSLMARLENQQLYFENFKTIIGGKIPLDSSITIDNKNIEKKPSFERSVEDSLLRILVESNETGMINLKNNVKNELFAFFAPVLGVVSDTFNLKAKHFGIDLVAKEKSRISSVLDGVVVVSHWTSETGYVIAIQHQNNYLSLYKHNSLLLKEVGDYVVAGEHVAVIGNSGELTTGPHLHFELWYNGVAVDPEKFIAF